MCMLCIDTAVAGATVALSGWALYRHRIYGFFQSLLKQLGF